MTHIDPAVPPGSIELPSRYAKAIVAILTAVVGLVVAALTDNVVTTVEVLGMVAFVLNAIGVELVRNGASGAAKYAKAIVAAVFLAVQAAIPIVAEGEITTSGWLLIILAGLNVFAVGTVPNAPAVKRVTT
jgi:hypothetical protein